MNTRICTKTNTDTNKNVDIDIEQKLGIDIYIYRYRYMSNQRIIRNAYEGLLCPIRCIPEFRGAELPRLASWHPPSSWVQK